MSTQLIQKQESTGIQTDTRGGKISVYEVMQIFDTYQFKAKNYRSITERFLNFLAERKLPINQYGQTAFLNYLKETKKRKNIAAYKTPTNKLIKLIAPAHGLLNLLVYVAENKTIIEDRLSGHFEEFLLSGNYSERTKETYRNAFKQFAGFCDARELSEFSSVNVTGFMDSVRKSGNAFTYNTYYTPLKRFAGYMVKNIGAILPIPEGLGIEQERQFRNKRENIAADLIRISENSSRMKVETDDYYKDALTEAEIQRVFEATRSAKEAFILGLMYYTGLRTFEVCKLEEKDFDWNPKRPTLSVVGKGGGRAKDIPLDHAYERLKSLHTSYLRVAKPDLSKGLFPELTTIQIRVFVNKLLKQTGLKKKKKKVSCHSFRHSLVQNLILRNVSIEKIKAVTRHKNYDTLKPYYQRLEREKELRIEANILA